MFGTSLLGKTVAWHPSRDEPLGWEFSHGGESIAEFGWIPEDGVVRVETERDVWHIGFSGVFMIRGTVRESLSAPSRILYAGTIRRGFAMSSEGVGFAFSPSWDWGIESFFNVSDEKGNEVLSKKGREENPHQWMEIEVTREAAYQRFVGPLLILWGGLRVLRQKRPYLMWLPSRTSERSARRVLDEWVSSVDPSTQDE